MTNILIPSLTALIIAQTLKFLLKSNHQEFNLKNIFAYSKMPSGHSALVVALTTSTGLAHGFDSSLFAITFIVTIIVIRDALGIRQYLGRHGKTLNILVRDLDEDKMLDEKYPHLIENVGHTPAEVFVGSLIGLLVSLAFYFL